MFERLFKNWVTTLLGIGAIGISIYGMVYMDITPLEFILGIVAGSILIWIKGKQVISYLMKLFKIKKDE